MEMTGERKLRFKSVGIISNPKKPEASSCVRKVLDILSSYDVKVFMDEETCQLIEKECRSDVNIVDRVNLPDKAEVMVVLGGDGTFLNVAKLVDKRKVPLLGVNFGTLGFLTEVTVDNVDDSIHRMLMGKFIEERRPAIRVKLIRSNGHVLIHRCINEVSIKRDILARIIEIEMEADGSFMSTFRGDGVIVATPTGSTAYSLSAGGPIIVPILDAILITPVCPHALTMRPLVVSGKTNLKVRLKTENETVMVIFDGQEGIELRKGDTLEITRSPYDLFVLRDPLKSYYQTLREKLNWG
jgi:NAD+ kinase